MSWQEIYNTRLAHSGLSGECQLIEFFREGGCHAQSWIASGMFGMPYDWRHATERREGRRRLEFRYSGLISSPRVDAEAVSFRLIGRSDVRDDRVTSHNLCNCPPAFRAGHYLPDEGGKAPDPEGEQIRGSQHQEEGFRRDHAFLAIASGRGAIAAGRDHHGFVTNR